MTNRYLDGDRPSPAADSPLVAGWTAALDGYRAKLDAYLLHDALAALWGFVGEANGYVDATKPWELAKVGKAGDAAAADRLRSVLGDLLESVRLVAMAATPFMPGISPRVLAQLGLDHPYAPDGNGGPPLLDELAWGARAGEAGRVAPPEPLFPRLDIETEDAAPVA